MDSQKVSIIDDIRTLYWDIEVLKTRVNRLSSRVQVIVFGLNPERKKPYKEKTLECEEMVNRVDGEMEDLGKAIEVSELMSLQFEVLFALYHQLKDMAGRLRICEAVLELMRSEVPG